MNNYALSLARLIELRTKEQKIKALAKSLIEELKAKKKEEIVYLDHIINRCKEGDFKEIPRNSLWILPSLFDDKFLEWYELYPAKTIPFYFVRTFLDNLFLKVYKKKRDQLVLNDYLDTLEAQYYEITHTTYQPRIKLPDFEKLF